MAAHTRIAWRAALKDFAAALGLDPATLDPGAITDAVLCLYVEARAGIHKPATITARASILRGMAEDAGVPIVGRHHRDALTVLRRAEGVRQRQVKGLLSSHRALATCPDTPLGLRDAALSALATCTAARESELLSYRFEDVDAKGRTVLLRRIRPARGGSSISPPPPSSATTRRRIGEEVLRPSCRGEIEDCKMHSYGEHLLERYHPDRSRPCAFSRPPPF